MTIPTARRAVVRIQLRLEAPLPPATGTRRVGELTAMIVGQARAGAWASHRPGDVEGIIWTTPRMLPHVIAHLREQPEVIGVLGDPAGA